MPGVLKKVVQDTYGSVVLNNDQLTNTSNVPCSKKSRTLPNVRLPYNKSRHRGTHRKTTLPDDVVSGLSHVSGVVHVVVRVSMEAIHVECPSCDFVRVVVSVFRRASENLCP